MNPSNATTEFEVVAIEVAKSTEQQTSSEAIRELASIELAYVGGGTGIVAFS